MDRPGYELPLLLLAAFRSIVDELHRDLALQGHPQARPVHGFALQAIGPDGVRLSELGRRLGISKQAVTKTAAGLERVGYAARERDAGDARAVRLVRTEAGDDFLRLSAAGFDRIRARWIQEIGVARVESLEAELARLAGDSVRRP